MFVVHDRGEVRVIIRSGTSRAASAQQAVLEATSSFLADRVPDLLLVFSSTQQDPHEVARALRERFPGVSMAGCMTAGAQVDREHLDGVLVVSALYTPEVQWSVCSARDLSSFDAKRAESIASSMLAGARLTRDMVSASKQFCLMFIDGLSRS
ncbi:MAG: FIST N-terminal domain-containing protein, partial [Polyangiaceae bacterium]